MISEENSRYFALAWPALAASLLAFELQIFKCMRVRGAQSTIAARGARPRRRAALFTFFLLVTAASSSFETGAAAQRHVKANLSPPPEALDVGLVGEADQRLARLGYWIDAPGSAKQDKSALIAFQKEEGLQKTGRLTMVELTALRSASPPTPVETGYAHLEVDLGKQVLFFVDAAGAVSRILPISTGSGKLFTSQGRTRRAVTPTGKFTVSRKIAGWHKSPLGVLYYPNYINEGIAIHGNPAVPVYPASHGCIRIPMFASKEFSELTPPGTVVIVHN
jgi:lipoprotein-anchoring transpeptidase ErfK/SrfK